jgi:hypothetical protein
MSFLLNFNIFVNNIISVQTSVVLQVSEYTLTRLGLVCLVSWSGGRFLFYSYGKC